MISCNSKHTLNLKKDNNNNNNYHHVKELIKDELSHILFVEGRPNLQKWLNKNWKKLVEVLPLSLVVIQQWLMNYVVKSLKL